jgi:molybdopterin synthase catalytic subunit
MLAKGKITESQLPPSGIYRKGSLKYDELMGTVLELAKGACGAVATYVGLVKSPGLKNREVKELMIETYPQYSDKMLLRICDEITKKYKLEFAVIYHFEGSFRVGETLVMVIVVGRSRTNVFPALEEAIHRYKTEPAIWKKEVYDGGKSKWVNK